MIADLLEGLLVNVKAGFRMALFLRVGENSIKAEPRSAMMLISLNLLVRFIPDFTMVGLSGEWLWDGMTSLSMQIALMFMVACLLAECCGKRSDVTELMVLLLAVAFPVLGLGEMIGVMLEEDGNPAWALSAIVIASVWMALATFKAVISLYNAQELHRVAIFCGLFIVFPVPLTIMQSPGLLWTDLEADSPDPKHDALTGEEAFYLQPKLLDRALAELHRQRPEKTELFFLGVAGDAEENVFQKEVLSVQNVMAERFGTRGHAISLINNYQTVMQYPLASVTSLRLALMAMAKVMDKDNDILFLFLTSHGFSDHSVALEFSPLRLDPLNPEVLSRILDESAIKWRVVVVSACYSGGFAGPLSNEQTIVITASAADRSSFGCGDQTDWTYFGKAFFDEALRDENDLAVAFRHASQSIARREREENIDEPSEPMISVGPAINLKWKSFIKLGLP